MTIVVTGVAGFIGMHVAEALLARGQPVIGIDSVNDYYSVALKEARLARLADKPGFRLVRADIADRDAIQAQAPAMADATGMVHLAAQAGVRYSLENPYAYIDANVMGHTVMLEAARRMPKLEHVVYASSSSVYGGNKTLPFSVADRVDRPVSLYAATKKAGELIAHCYSHLYGLPATGLRFFTVYGPWGRPDMAAYLFADAIMAGRPIRVFNQGQMQRDFTYIDDIVGGVLGTLDNPAPPDADGVRHRVFNLGNHRSESLMDFIGVLEQALGRKAQMVLEPMQPGDVAATFADIEATRAAIGFTPRTPIADGLPRFVQWYKSYHGIAG
ncbi:UDP-glucuronate 4-epimerase [Azospirillum fermentarium]|uniref:NAD-dependent epimerase/dehydratase family protein n=1 Tax=Azospirillum fermentarium TaxID=1233114 RepID=UPI002226C517|nr:NAD-dependent epimerase/dehydratase family protein [Azospirillum fermentarium]MCW2249200.1 UDP-glucuronate 4-epimerase [Azospirillum fermentarium]